MAKSRSNSTNKVKVTKGKAGSKKKSVSVQSKGLKTKADVAKFVFEFMCQEHAFGVTEWTKEELATAAGFKNPRTEKFAHGLSKVLMEEQGLAQNGSTKGTFALSAMGLARMPREVQPKSLEEFHERFISQLEAKVACGANKVRPLWELLTDRKTHTIDSIARHLGYKNTRSFMNTKVLGLMVTMELITKTPKSVTMTDKAFPTNLANESVVEF